MKFPPDLSRLRRVCLTTVFCVFSGVLSAFADEKAADLPTGELVKAAESGEYAVLFVTENYALPLAQDMARYKDAPLPAITVIPGRAGGTGYGMAALRAAAERAIGADILFKD